jgi:hypothetical protein
MATAIRCSAVARSGATTMSTARQAASTTASGAERVDTARAAAAVTTTAEVPTSSPASPPPSLAPASQHRSIATVETRWPASPSATSRRLPRTASSGPNTSQMQATVHAASTGRITRKALPSSGSTVPCGRSAARQAQQAATAPWAGAGARQAALTSSVSAA